MLRVYSETLFGVDRHIQQHLEGRARSEKTNWAGVTTKAVLFYLALRREVIPAGDELTAFLLKFRITWMAEGKPEPNWIVVYHLLMKLDGLCPMPVELLANEINRLLDQNYVEPHCTMMSLINNSFFVSRMLDIAFGEALMEQLNATGT